MTKQVICITWGPKYGPRYVNRLYAMVARNITPPFTFTCFCDDPTGFYPAIDAQPLPPLDVEMPRRTHGIWPKARLWGTELGGLHGPVLFCDLDLVVTGSLDPFFTHGEPDDVILARNPTVPLERLGQTSLFRFPVGKLAPLQDAFRADPQGIADTYRFEQRFVTRQAPGGIGFWPKAWVRNFKQHCQRPFPLNYFLEPRLPKDARVVIFPGRVSPHDVVAGQWGSDYPVVSGPEHIRLAFSGEHKHGVWRYLRHYFIKPRWVEAAWRED
jgi:hypothetical protein